jgi:hypothetical protein
MNRFQSVPFKLNASDSNNKIMNHQYIAIGQEVVFVGHDKKEHKGKILNVYGPDTAQIEFGGNTAIAEFSDKKEPITFHFEQQASPKAEDKK